jgi:hypothetical protein
MRALRSTGVHHAPRGGLGSEGEGPEDDAVEEPLSGRRSSAGAGTLDGRMELNPAGRFSRPGPHEQAGSPAGGRSAESDVDTAAVLIVPLTSPQRWHCARLGAAGRAAVWPEKRV